MLMSQMVGIIGNCSGCETPRWVPSARWLML